ncbi:MAG TPA: ABC transporter substrate-binding protein, partial [Thermodesulfovibrionales bacterium]|nr:ABC transporter substrate-binding protein [Thermodesulfovibrionales bacterium]
MTRVGIRKKKSGVLNWRIFPICFLLAIYSCSYHNRLDGYVYYRVGTSPTTLDPALIVDVTGSTIAAKLFNGLVRLDKDLNIIPDIAESWRISRDGLSYTFKLNHNVKFNNKQIVTSYDFKYSFKRILDPKTRSPNTWVLEKIKGAKDYLQGKTDDVKGLKIIDEHTLEIRLVRPFSPFLYLLTMSAAYVVPEEEVKRWGPDFSSHPVGTGPFVLKEWLSDRELRLERQESYFGKKPQIQ